MARTFRSVPAWIAATPEADSYRASKYFRRAARGQDGAVRSEIAMSAKDGKRDDWSTAPKGRANKRIAGKQIRRYRNGEATRDMEAERLEDKREAEEAEAKESLRASLEMALEWEEEAKREAEWNLQFANHRIEQIRAKLAEIA